MNKEEKKVRELISSIIKEELSLNKEAKEDSKDEAGAEDEEINIEDEAPEEEVDLEGGEEFDADLEGADMGGLEAEIQDLLSAAIEKAKEMGDPKLVKQIGNTITFFTRSHVVGDEAEMGMDGIDLQENRAFVKKMQVLAGIKK